MLPPRVIDESRGNERLRGHARNPARLDELRRQLMHKGLSEEQLQRVADMMDSNEQVSPPPPLRQYTPRMTPPAWVLGGGVGSASFATAPGGPAGDLFSRIQAQGFTAPDKATTPMEKLAETLISAANGGKAPKAFALPASFGEWVLKIREEGWATPDLHATNPKYYWALEWIRQTVEFINFEYSWAVAGEYFDRVMFEWKNSWLDPSTYAAKEVFKCGHIRAAVMERCLTDACKAAEKKGKSKGATSTSKWAAKGTKARVNATDTWCSCHQLYYLAADDHHWDATTSTGTCLVAKSRAAGGGARKKKK